MFQGYDNGVSNIFFKKLVTSLVYRLLLRSALKGKTRDWTSVEFQRRNFI